MKLIREFWLTLRAAAKLVRDFFVRWFLPLHTEDEEPVAPEDRWEEDEEIAHEAGAGEESPEPTEADIPSPDAGERSPASPSVPVIAPPTGAEERVSRGSAAGGFQVLSGTEEPASSCDESAPAEPAPQCDVNPFAPEPREEQS